MLSPDASHIDLYITLHSVSIKLKQLTMKLYPFKATFLKTNLFCWHAKHSRRFALKDVLNLLSLSSSKLNLGNVILSNPKGNGYNNILSYICIGNLTCTLGL